MRELEERAPFQCLLIGESWRNWKRLRSYLGLEGELGHVPVGLDIEGGQW